MFEQEEVEYTDGFFRVEVMFAIDKIKRARKGWELISSEEYRSRWLRLIKIKAISHSKVE